MSIFLLFFAIFIFTEISLSLSSISSGNVDIMIEKLKMTTLGRNFKKISITGGGSFKFSKELKNLLGSYNFEDEMSSIVEGAFFAYRLSNYELKSSFKYPLILVNIGTGASFILVDENKKFKRIGGTNLAGGTLTGIFSLMSQNTTIDELSDCIFDGNKNNVDILVRDIYGSSYESIKLNENTVAGSLAKVGQYSGDNLISDVCASSAYMICSNIVHLIYLYSSIHGALTIFFSGTFSSMPTIKTLLNEILDARFSNTIETKVLEFGSYLGCFGLVKNIVSE